MAWPFCLSSFSLGRAGRHNQNTHILPLDLTGGLDAKTHTEGESVIRNWRRVS